KNLLQRCSIRGPEKFTVGDFRDLFQTAFIELYRLIFVEDVSQRVCQWPATGEDRSRRDAVYSGTDGVEVDLQCFHCLAGSIRRNLAGVVFAIRQQNENMAL